MAWIDTTYLNNRLTSGQATGLGASDSSVFAQFEAAARAKVQAVLLSCGYVAVGSTLTAGTDTTAYLQELVASIMVRDMYGSRKGLRLPQWALDGCDIIAAMMRDGRTGSRTAPPVPGLDRNTRDGIGGASFPSTQDGTGSALARPTRFQRNDTGGL